ncbi:MAG: TIGR02679 family protein [Thermoanaerobaculia bacterium]
MRDRLERLGGPRGTVRLADAGEDERRAVADLLGLAELPRGELRIRLDRLDRALRGSRLGIGLPAALEALGGPLRDLSGEREDERLRWQEIWERAEAHPIVEARPGLRRWLADLRSSGLLRRLAPGLRLGEQGRLLGQALAVLALLPREARLPVLASEALGASHALDPGRPAATLVLRALAVLADRPPPKSAAERRDLWESAGVIADDLSCDVLVLGLAPAGGGRIEEALRAFAAEGEPIWLTLRHLAGRDLLFPSPLVVHVCENPVVVSAAADRWSAQAVPLVCLGGYPNQAGLRLLARLASQGADLLYHGDFDWPGLQIANHLLKTVPIRPWRFTAPDYLRALEAEAERPRLGDRPVAARWDPDLAPAMEAAGVAVEEETVLEELLGDLGLRHV